MEFINGGDVKVGASSIITYCCHQYVPDEIWLEIISRLPIKSLYASRCVCKSWKKLSSTLVNKINTNPVYVPLCGLLLVSFLPVGDQTNIDCSFSYFSLGNEKGEMICAEFDSPEEKLIYNSGIERGLLSDLAFDFSILHKVREGVPENQYLSVVMHGGSLLVTFKDSTCDVHNPLTCETYYVPESRTVLKYGFDKHTNEEKCGILVQFPSYVNIPSYFIVVRFCTRLRIMEVYNNMVHRWIRYPLMLDDKLLPWRFLLLRYYAAFFEDGVLSLYLLTKKDRGVAIKFKGPMNPEMKQYSFPLPAVIHGQMDNTRIWECEKSLYLSNYNNTGIWIWKAGCTQVDAWAWILVLDMSPKSQLCKPVIRTSLSKNALNGHVRIVPLALNPNIAVVYLLFGCKVFAYNLTNDTIDMIGMIQDREDKSVDVVYTFKPCLSAMNAGEESPGVMDTRAMETKATCIPTRVVAMQVK